MILSTFAFVFLLKYWSGRLMVMPALIRSGGGVFAKELRAGALSVLTLITSERRTGVVDWMRPWRRSCFCSEGMKQAVVKFEKRSVVTKISCLSFLNTSA